MQVVVEFVNILNKSFFFVLVFGVPWQKKKHTFENRYETDKLGTH